MVVVLLLVLGVAGAVVHSRNPDWVFFSNRTMYVLATRGSSSLLVTCYDYADRLTANAALTQAYEEGEPAPEGRHPSTKEVSLLAYDPTAKTSTALTSELEVLALPDVPGRLFIRRAAFGENDVLVAEPGSGTPWLRMSPDGSNGVTQVDGRLYLVCRDTSAVKLLTPGVIDGYVLEDLLVLTSGTEGSVLWVDQPVWDEDGRRVFYLSNRKGVAEGTRELEIWSVDIATGQNALVCQHAGIYILGFYQGLVVFSDSVGVKTVDPSTGEIRTVVETGRFLGFRAGALCTADDYLASSEAIVTHIASGDQQVLRAPPGKTFTRLVPGPDASVIVGVLRDANSDHSLASFHTNPALTVEYPPLPDRYTTVSAVFFLNNDTLLINLWKTEAGKVVEASYLLNLRGGQRATLPW